MAGAVNMSRDVFQTAKKTLDPLLGLQIASPGGNLEPL